MRTNYTPKEIENLIITQLVEHGEVGFNDLLRFIHESEKKQSLSKGIRWSGRKGELAVLTLQRYLKKLIKLKVVCQKKGKTPKREVYTLTEKSGSYILEGILTEFAQLKNTLDFYDKKPFFGFFEPEHFEKGTAPTQTKALADLRDALGEITNRLDGYLKTSEVKSE